MIFIWPAATIPPKSLHRRRPPPVTVYRPRVSNGYACHYRRVVARIVHHRHHRQWTAPLELVTRCGAIPLTHSPLKRCEKGGEGGDRIYRCDNAGEEKLSWTKERYFYYLSLVEEEIDLDELSSTKI